MDQHLLSVILFAPLAGMLVLLLIPSSSKTLIKVWANLVGFACFLVSLPLVTRFDKSIDGYQMVERADWIPSLGAKYLIGVDGISLLLVMLTTVVSFLAVLSSWNAIEDRLKEYYAAFKFFLYTLSGSVLMLLGILTLYFKYSEQFGVYTFEIAELMKLDLPLATQQFVFWTFFIGFAIKVPMFPFHTWLPDAHVEAPTAGSVILASVLLKMGTYGFLRFSLPLLPQASVNREIVQV